MIFRGDAEGGPADMMAFVENDPRFREVRDSAAAVVAEARTIEIDPSTDAPIPEVPVPKTKTEVAREWITKLLDENPSIRAGEALGRDDVPAELAGTSLENFRMNYLGLVRREWMKANPDRAHEAKSRRGPVPKRKPGVLTAAGTTDDELPGRRMVFPVEKPPRAAVVHPKSGLLHNDKVSQAAAAAIAALHELAKELLEEEEYQDVGTVSNALTLIGSLDR